MKFTTSVPLVTLLPALTSAFPLLPSLFNKRVTDLNATTQNDLFNGTPCKQVTIIFARGTTSPGNVGESTGPPFFTAVANLIGINNLAVQGVDYSASIFGFLGGGDSQGSVTMKNYVEQALTACPSTKLVMSGYSQGAQLVHNAARQLSDAATAKISSVVMFGDPFDGSVVGRIPASKVKTFCHDGDNICDGGILVLPPHKNYYLDAPAAAAFVKQQAGL